MSESPTETDGSHRHATTVIPADALVPGSPGSSGNEDEETESLDATVSNYVQENGRTYHRFKEGSYPFPNDIRELERWDTQYDTIKWLLKGNLHFSPLEDPDEILDIGTGTGKWAIEMGEKYPDARITGTDLAPTQPQDVPPNVYFDIEDCSEDEWARDEESFDLIHTQMMVGSQTSFKKLIRTAYKHLKPNDGWLECVELEPNVKSDDASLLETSPVKEWEDLLNLASEEKLYPPRPIRYAQRIGTWMRAIGYVDVKEQIYKLPIGPWPSDPAYKELGRRWGNNLLEGASAFSYRLLGPEGLGWNRGEIEVYLVNIRRYLKDRNSHSYQTLHVVYGRRPSKEEEAVIRDQAAQRRKERERQRGKAAAAEKPGDVADAAHAGPSS